MSRGSRLTLPAHGVLELFIGTVMMIAPVRLGFSPIALIMTAALGAVLTGMGLLHAWLNSSTRYVAAS
jgi:hypothetical protein